jgi:O-phosphoseryl-tRNA(Cys) synthetase
MLDSIPIRDELLEIRNELVNIAFQDEYKQEDILHIQERLREIDNGRGKNDIFLNIEPGDDALALIGQGTLVDILENGFNACHALLNSDNTLIIESIRKRLIEIKNDLQGIELTSKWSLRQTDLFSYQLQLYDIARMLHKEVQFEGEEGSSLLSYLLASCYNIMLILLGDVGPSVAESLMPKYNQLNTLRE